MTDDSVAAIRFGVLTVSDGCAAGVREDGSGEAIVTWCADRGHVVVDRDVVPDDAHAITRRLLEWADSGRLDVILTTGGTGFTERDVTPEATASVLEKEAPGIAEAMRRKGAEQTPAAILSRGLTGSRGSVFLANLPGSTGGVRDGLDVLDGILSHLVQLLRGEATAHPTREGTA